MEWTCPLRKKASSLLAQEAAGLLALSEALPETFEPAVTVLAQCKGKVVFTGMGKSGHVAQKIAATFCSTGTPSFFLHPAEASHGDVGALAHEDVLVLLSNSGETQELFPLLHYATFLEIPRLLITKRSNSALAKEATLVLEIPQLEEACSLGLAPTTSACMMMGLGDALAMALLEKNHFTQEHYHRLHQGGQLGHQLSSVSAVMHKESAMPLIGEDALMEEAILEMNKKRFGCVGITNAQGALVGIISDGDLRRHMAPDLLSQKVSLVMTASPKTISEDMLVQEALFVMHQKNITVLFVVDAHKKPLGLMHMHDCFKGNAS